MPNPLVSIIVPIYKVEPYLRRCLDSIVNQTYTNLEIILVDDGSPDGCPAICDEYAAKDSRIVVIHKDNGGLSDARNAGLDICKGEYISFVDSDDWISENLINDFIFIAKKEKSSLVIGNHEKFRYGECIPKITPTENYSVISSFQALEYLSSEYGLNFTVSWGKLYKKSLWDTIRFPKGKLYEDAYVCYLIYAAAVNICFVNAPFYKYLQRDDSIMGQTKDPLHATEAKILFYYFLKKTSYTTIANAQIQPLFCFLISFFNELMENDDLKEKSAYCLKTIVDDFCNLSHQGIKDAKINESFLCWKIIIFYTKHLANKKYDQQLLTYAKKMTTASFKRRQISTKQVLSLKIVLSFSRLLQFYRKLFV